MPPLLLRLTITKLAGRAGWFVALTRVCRGSRAGGLSGAPAKPLAEEGREPGWKRGAAGALHPPPERDRWRAACPAPRGAVMASIAEGLHLGSAQRLLPVRPGRAGRSSVLIPATEDSGMSRAGRVLALAVPCVTCDSSGLASGKTTCSQAQPKRRRSSPAWGAGIAGVGRSLTDLGASEPLRLGWGLRKGRECAGGSSKSTCLLALGQGCR